MEEEQIKLIPESSTGLMIFLTEDCINKVTDFIFFGENKINEKKVPAMLIFCGGKDAY